ncbi:MAG: hypothetical protein R3281_06820 [Balneolaceae bacterium]|nr:hypothetical protein [Balneolaceae bacterium]
MNSENSENISLQNVRKLDAQFDAQLWELQDAKKSVFSSAKYRKRLHPFGWLARFLLAVIMLLLPFFVLIRTAIYSYAEYGVPGWGAVATGLAATLLLLVVYGLYMGLRFGITRTLWKYLIYGLMILVVAYGCYGALYLYSVNLKSETERQYYYRLHPVLRITLATATLADSDILITDAHRTSDEYQDMGMRPRQQSLHYVQSTGYVHAVDLRTLGRAEWKNWLTRQAFDWLGYHTLRHSGTADHLHVSLPLND